MTVVHNGIIENYATLRRRAGRRRARVPLRHRLRGDRAPRRGAATRATWSRPCARRTPRLDGHFAFAVAHRDSPEHPRRGPPRLPAGGRRGRGRDVHGVGHPGLPQQTRRVQYVQDDEIVVARPGGATFLTGAGDGDRARASRRSTGTRRRPRSRATRRSCSRRSRSSPTRSPRRSASGSTTASSSSTASSCPTEQIRDLSRVVFLACGTSYHAGLIGRYLLEEWARRPVGVGHRQRVALPARGDRRAHARDRGRPVGRDDRHAGGDEGGPRPRRPRPRGHERDGQRR